MYAARREVVDGVSRLFAIKLLHPQLRTRPEVAAELLDEARVAASIRHANVVEVVEALETSAGVCLVMAYVEGDTLSALLRSAFTTATPIPLPIVARIMLDALAGLRAAHEARSPDGESLHLVHRDFSPQNLLVGIDGLTRLSDFGIAKFASQQNETATGIVKGKIGYMAPEQALGKVLDGRSDLWAAGVVCWETITGQRLLKSQNDANAILNLVSGANPPPPSSFRGVPPAVDALLASVLVRDRDQRIATAQAFFEAWEAAWPKIASHAEVGSYVRSVVGESLLERSAALEQATRRLSRDAATISDVAMTPPP